MSRRIVFSAGGQLGIAFIGTVRALEIHYRCSALSKHIPCFEGTSAGALCAFFLSLGLSSLELLFYYQQVPDYAPNLGNISAGRLGFSNIEVLMRPVIKTALIKSGIAEANIDTLTFAEFHAHTGLQTVFGMTIIGPKDRELNASHETVPDWPIVSCLLSSMAIPGIFEPVAIETPEGTLYGIDGAVSNPFRFPRVPVETDIGVVLLQEMQPIGFNPTTHNIWNYFNFVFERFFYYLAKSRSAEFSANNVITITCPYTSLIYRPTQETTLNLLRAGELACAKFVGRSIP